MWKIANILSLIRLFAAVPVFILMMKGMRQTAFIITVLAFITDFFDGYFARLYNSVSELGKILDPIADKVLLAAIGLALYLCHNLPLWFILAIISRDVIILIGGYYAKKSTDFVLPSNYTGKVTFAVLALTISGIFLEFDYFDTWGIFISTSLIILSLIIYIVRYFKFMKRSN